MNHLESSFTGKNAFWRYLVMILAVFAVINTIGALPLLIRMGIKAASDPTVLSKLAKNPTDLTVLGISSNMGLLLTLFQFVTGLLALLLLLKPLNKRSLTTVINGTKHFRWNRFFISFAIWTIISAIYLFVSLKADPANFTLNKFDTSTFITLIIISVCLIPLQSGLEEILFRAYLMQGFAVLFRNRILPLIATSLLFGLMHGLNPEIKAYGFWTMLPQYILFGLIFGIMTIMDDGAEAAIGAHSANNIFLCIMVTNASFALQAPAMYVQHKINPWMDFLSMLIMGAVIILISAVIFRWKNFKILFGKIMKNPEIQML
jgi:uncharacterized protein